ncbi:hypothetical protein OROGR_017063 [Orobanche gracilis]
MTSTYTPTYYTSLHESITSICKTILPFSFKKRRIPAIAAAEQRLSKQQSDNLKWQQEAFHQLLKLMGLCKEAILHENEVHAFRTHLIETITESTIDHEPAVILRDKLIFLQDLFYAKCITEDEYHASKRPLLQRLAVQGAKIIRESDVIVGECDEISNEDWSVVIIDMKEKKQRLLVNTERFVSNNSNGGSSVSAFVSTEKNGNTEEGKDASGYGILRSRDGNIRNKLLLSTENPFWNSCLDGTESETKSILMADNEKQSGDEKGKRKPFGTVFKRNENEEVHRVVHSDEHDPAFDDKEKIKLVKRTWGFGGFRKSKKNKSEDGTVPFPLIEDDQIEETSDIHDLKKFFPSDAVLDVVREIGNFQVAAEEKRQDSKTWTMFNDEENTHPNLFVPQDHSYPMNAHTCFSSSSSIDQGLKYNNPFFEL